MPRAQTTVQRRSKNRQPISSTPLNLRRSARTQNTDSFNESHSQSRTQTQTQTQLEQSFVSISTASLPDKYEINLALPINVKLTDAHKEEAYVRGEEILSDGWRKSTDVEGRLRDLRKRQHLLKRSVKDAKTSTAEEAVVGDQLQPLWYTADLAFPCVCSLDGLRYAYAFAHAPPDTASLGLPGVETSIDTANIPGVAPLDLLKWASNTTVDLDPTLDHIDDFEPLWADPPLNLKPASQISDNGTVVESPESIEARRERKGKYWAIDVDILLEQQGLPKPVDILRLHDQVGSKPAGTQPVGGPQVSLTSSDDIHGDGSTTKDDAVGINWEEESKRRKSWWRKIIQNDAGYGKIWNVVPLPYSHPARQFSKRKKKKRLKTIIPPYKLPRAYISQAPPNPQAQQHSNRSSDAGCHPFHPSLFEYMIVYPRRRVYWLIPLHGPVLIPTLNHPLDNDGDYLGEVPHASVADNKTNKIVPSTGYFFDSPVSELSDESSKKIKPAPIEWTKSALLSFLENFLHPLYLDPDTPVGHISYAFSGPKPDPFLDLPTPKPLENHLDVSPLSSMTAGDKATGDHDALAPGQAQNSVEHSKAKLAVEPAPPIGTKPNFDLTGQPVRPEAGDHLRIYCDATHALPLRTWLHNVRIPISGPNANVDTARGIVAESEGDSVPQVNGESRELRIFYKIRLTLVGDRGEVLIVA
ncbi:hypothetical protein IAT40_002880 [Kwoniella sp. CBS 6097]